MDRRKYIKTMALGSVLPSLSTQFISRGIFSCGNAKKVNFKSDWQNWPNMKWIGASYWANPLQDWELIDGKTTCMVNSKDRNLHLLTVQKQPEIASFNIQITINLLNPELSAESCYGLRLGAQGPFEDYRSAAVFGKGLDIGFNGTGAFVLGEKTLETSLIKTPSAFILKVIATPEKDEYKVSVEVTDPENQALIFSHEEKNITANQLTGNFALLANGKSKGIEHSPSVAFSDWSIKAHELLENENNTFGPICFAQYTLNKNKLKLTVQCTPVEVINDHALLLQVKDKGKWTTLKEAALEPSGRAVNFEIDQWNRSVATPYRVLLKMTVNGKMLEYEYAGTIDKEPLDKNEIKAAVFSCNFHHGFPDSDIPENVSKLNPDIILFLGDQFYEGSGGYGPLFSGPLDKLCLDYLRKWYMFGWSYRELFRHKPCAIIPDDHDVYHGNVWGEGGKNADMSNGVYAPAQDSGGYKMPAEWVNMIQFTQTSHLPDAFDPRPVKQGIGVYYTHWNYGGISFAILEDRKFKSAPKNVLPPEADVYNGWIRNENFDIKKHRDIKAELLGDRQYDFLDEWVKDWSNQAEIKVVLSQTNFATVATLPASAKTDDVVPSLPLPKKGEYVLGDRPTVDMDSNGWPANQRDRAVEIIRKGFAFHIAGDQHLPSFIQYGVDGHRDSGFAFGGPALNNIWPRRFWPEVDSSEHSYEKPAYLGDHIDGFGNKFSLEAVANPYNTGRTPEIIHNRSTGFGFVTFNKEERTIKTECWPRFVDPIKEPNGQYGGWPITVNQEDNYGRKAAAWLPTLKVKGSQNPLIQVFDQNDELVYAIRIKSETFAPKVFQMGDYKIRLANTETGKEKWLPNLKAKTENNEVIELEL